MGTIYDDLIAKVTEARTVQASLITLADQETGIIGTLKDSLAKALSGENVSPAVQAKIQEALGVAQATIDEAKAAVTANTPADNSGGTTGDGGGTTPPTT